MGDEIELKFLATPQQLRQLKASRLLRPTDGTLVTTGHLRSVYYDTDARLLRDNRVALRLRHGGDRVIQTIKTGSSATLSRGEWESEILGEGPDFDAARDTPLQPLLTDEVKRALRPLFETRVRRSLSIVTVNASIIEVAFDEGRLQAGRKSEPISEIELELKHGSAADLFALARALQRRVPLAPSFRNKAERGYELAGGKSRAKRQDIVLPPQASAVEALRAIAFVLLQQIVAQRQAVIAGQPEGVHQMRIGLRRLRAALSIFAELLGDPESERIKAGLKWLAGRLAAARDLDVMLARVKADKASRGQSSDLRTLLAKQREAAFVRAAAAVQQRRTAALLLETLQWIETGDWATQAAQAPERRAARDFAEQVLTTRLARIKRKASKLAELDAGKRHRLRIALKKLYYAVGFFESLFVEHKTARRLKSFKKKLKRLLDDLGLLNDAAVHRQLSARVVGKAPRAVKARAARQARDLSSRERDNLDGLLKASAKAGRKLARAEPF
jgi:inorganic triphosphatase YgiF